MGGSSAAIPLFWKRSGTASAMSSVVYPANLCLVLWDVEFAGKREDFGKPIGKAVESASHRTVWQSAAEHFHDMLRGAQRVKDA